MSTSAFNLLPTNCFGLTIYTNKILPHSGKFLEKGGIVS